jgi:hypothetical protein
VTHACNPSYSRGGGRRITSLRPAWAKLARPYLKNKVKAKRAEGVIQGMEGLPGTFKGLGSALSKIKQTKRNKLQVCLWGGLYVHINS